MFARGWRVEGCRICEMSDGARHVFVATQLGIKDIDAYGHIWYGNYMKFFARAVCAFLGPATVRRVEHLKYKKSIAWGAADSRIESYLVARPTSTTALVYQRWCVGDSDDNALCLCLVELGPHAASDVPVMEGSARLDRKGPKLAMAVKNLQTGAVKPPGEGGAPIGRLVARRTIFADMLPSGARHLQLVDVMDLFEQSRSEVVGGQPGLKAFLAAGLTLVVGQIDELVLADAGAELDELALGDAQLRCEVTLLRETVGRRCFEFEQRLSKPSGAEVARVRVLMCCVDPAKGELSAVPDSYWAQWNATLGEFGTE